MGREEPVNRLRDMTQALYRAALQPRPLDHWSRLIANLLGTNVAGLTVLAPSGLAVENGFSGADKEAAREFMEHYQYINPLRQFWQTAPSGQVVSIDQSLFDGKLRGTEFYSRYHEHLDAGRSIYMILGIRRARVLVHASQPGRGGLGSRECDLLRALREDLLLSFEIAGTLSLAANMTANIIGSLDEKGIGMAVLSEDGQVEHANGSMNEILRAGHVLRIERGRLAPGASVSLPELSAAVHRTKKSGVGGRVCFTGREPGSRPGSIITYPAPVSFEWEESHERKVVLLVTDNSRPGERLTGRLRKGYGLTQAEARVAGMLLEGNTTRQMATALAVQINSVRAHLKATYAKTGTHSQVELMKLLQTEREQVH